MLTTTQIIPIKFDFVVLVIVILTIMLRNTGTGGEKRLFGRIYSLLIDNYWNPYIAVGLAGLLSAFYFGITGTVWAVTGEFTRFGGHILQAVGVDISDWAYYQMIGMDGSSFDRTDGWIVFGMLIGALITVLLGNNFKIRVPQQRRRLVQGFIGGIIAGFGARLALGCNLAAFFTGVPQFSFHSWIFMFTTAIGAYFGVKIVNTPWWRGKANLKRFSKAVAQPASPQQQRKIQPYWGALLALVFAGILVYYVIDGRPLIAAAALFGAGFGILIERGQVCFTSAFRDLWVSGRATLTKAIAAGMIISTVVTFILIQSGMEAIIKVAAPSTFIGGLLFGIGIVLAGGCETGMMYRVMEGQVLFWSVFAGNIVGATFLAFSWDHLGLYDVLVEGWTAVNLIEAWGPANALLATLVLLGSWFLFGNWWEKHYRFGRGLKVTREHFVPQSRTSES